MLLTEEESTRRAQVEALGYDYGAQPKVLIERCNLCGSTSFVGLANRDRYFYPARADGCMSCGLVFLNPVMTSDAYREFYTSVYRPLVSAYHGRRIDELTIQEEQRAYAERALAVVAPFLSPDAGGVLLDIGGSTGVVAHHMASRLGLSAVVLDPAPLEIEEARLLGLETVVGTAEEFDPGEQRFDVVLMCQTVDHLLDVASALAGVRRLVARDAVFFVDIVDFRAAYIRNWKVEEAVKIDHPYYLTEPVIHAYLSRAGFEVLRKQYAADALHVGYVCRASEPQTGALPVSDTVDLLLREIRLVQNTPGPVYTR